MMKRLAVVSTIVRCPQCGWRGIPTIIGGQDQPKCPCVGCDGKLTTFTTLSDDS